VTVTVGLNQTLTATTLSSTGAVLTGRTVTWTTSNGNIATVTGGVVTGIAPGSATITASSEGRSQTAAATVSAPPPAQASFASITPGGNHTCALNAAGKAFCWGSNQFGQIGIATPGGLYMTPQAVTGNPTFTSLSAAMYHTCALNSAGAAFCWGWNIKGQLGDGSNVDRNAPAAVSGNLTFTSITTAGQAGGEHTCALTQTGAAYCWGWNVFGQLGDGTTTDRATPVAVLGGLTFASLSAGNLHTCGLTAAGRAYCWGSASEIGEGAGAHRSSPTAVAGNHTFKALVATWWSACGITTADATYCWGYTTSSTQPITQPTLVQGQTFTQLTSGNQAVCGLIASGAAYCWGVNSSGQIGDGTSSNRAAPVPVSGNIVFASVRIGNAHTCGLTPSGAAYCWGNNNSGQVGDGSQLGKLVPVAVRSP
jgi:alpha-tubulin suppressor-like RCC1 family protein